MLKGQLQARGGNAVVAARAHTAIVQLVLELAVVVACFGTGQPLRLLSVTQLEDAADPRPPPGFWANVAVRYTSVRTAKQQVPCMISLVSRSL